MSWFARKFTKSDIVDHQQVAKEYFEKKAEKAVQDKLLAMFWKEMEEDQKHG